MIFQVVNKDSVLENVRQHQQNYCQEIFNKISSQEIFLHFAGNFVILYTGMPNNLLIKFFVCLHGDKIYNSFVCGNTT